MNKKLVQSFFLSLLIPCIACAIQWFFWDQFQPFIWFLFYPAIFFSAQIGGRWGGMAATGLSTLLAVFFFTEPLFSFNIIHPNVLYSGAVFILMGFLFSDLQERFKREQQKLQESESTLRKLNTELEARVNERALELQKKEERFRNLFENLVHGVTLQDARGYVIEANPAAEKILGLTLGELQGLSSIDPHWKAIHEDGSDFPGETHPAMVVLQTGQPVHDVMMGVYHQTSNSYRWININASPRFNPGEEKPYQVYTTFEDITERRNAQKALITLAERLDLATRSAQIGIWDWNILHNNLVWDDLMYKLYGLNQGKFPGAYEAWLNGVHPDDREFSNQVSQQAVRGEKEYDTEFRVLWPDGSVHWLKSAGQVFRNESGDPVRMVGINYDITENKRAEQAKLESRSRLDAALASMTDAVFISDLQGNFIEFNEAFATYHKFKNKEECAKTFAEYPNILDVFMANGELAPTEMWAVPRALRGETVTNAEYSLRRKDTGEAWVGSYSFAPIRDKESTIIGSVVVGRDITTNKMAEEKIRVQAEQLKILADASQSFATAGIDYQTMLELVARTTSEQFGAGCAINLLSDDEQFLQVVTVYDTDPAMQENVLGFIRHLSIPIDSMDPSAVTFRSGQPLVIPVVDLDSTRRTLGPEMLKVFDLVRPYSVLISPLRVHNHAIGTLSFIRFKPGQPSFNEDDLLLAQELADRAALAISNAHLFEQAQNELTQRRQAEEELRRSNAELEQFAYVASHDLQEPLRAVAGMVQLLGQRYKGKLDERADQYIDHAVEASVRMQKLINDLLDYSRVDRFGKSFELADMEKLLNTALSNLQVSIQESNARITHDPLPTVTADTGQLIQVLQNLIANAIKFRGKRTPQIHIGVEKVENAWRFSIHDNGIGIEPQYFERIFLVFQRLHTRSEYPGTGIGLSLCKKIVERHGGQIWVESQAEQGSTFYFTIQEK